MDPRLKQIKIKTGVVKRLAKEKAYYAKDAQKMEDHIQKMKDTGADSYDIKKQEEVKQESEMMIPDCERKCGAAWDDLKKIIDEEEDLAESEEYKAAEAMLEECKEAANRK